MVIKVLIHFPPIYTPGHPCNLCQGFNHSYHTQKSMLLLLQKINYSKSPIYPFLQLIGVCLRSKTYQDSTEYLSRQCFFLCTFLSFFFSVAGFPLGRLTCESLLRSPCVCVVCHRLMCENHFCFL